MRMGPDRLIDLVRIAIGRAGREGEVFLLGRTLGELLG